MSLGLTIAGLVNFVAFALYLMIMARIVVSWIGLSPWHPAVRWLRIIVDPVLRPFRRVLPAFAGIDFSPLLAILVIFFVAHVVTDALSFQLNIAASIVLLIRDVLLNIILIVGILVLVRLLLSLFHADPWHPLVVGIRSVTNPLVAPFAGLSRRGRPGGPDIPAIAAIATYVVLYFVVRLVFDQLFIRVL